MLTARPVARAGAKKTGAVPRTVIAPQTRLVNLRLRRTPPTPFYTSAQTRKHLASIAAVQHYTTANSPPPSSSSNLPQPLSPKKHSLLLRTLRILSLVLLTTTTGFIMGSADALPTANHLMNPPTDEETLCLYEPPTEPLADINEYILNHPLVVSLRQDPELRESRPHLKIPPSMRANSLTGGTLLGESKIGVPPLSFTTSTGTHLYGFQHLGPALCGHPGIVHGGLLATLLDEGLGRCCFPALPNKVGVTASLKIDYRKPCMADQYVVLIAETTKVEGRKAWVKGRLCSLLEEGEGEDCIGDTLVEAEALFIEPKQAAKLTRVYNTQ